VDLAWNTLDKIETDLAWDRFGETFSFNPSVHPENFPGISEPSPSITFEISRYFGDEDDNADLETKVLAGLRSQLSINERIYALDWQHPCYWFYPYREFTEWYVPALPNGDYYIFVSKDLSFGIFGHPWEWTSCVWGDGLISYFESNTPVLWPRVKRRKS
jgi:hypothetical protein